MLVNLIRHIEEARLLLMEILYMLLLIILLNMQMLKDFFVINMIQMWKKTNQK